MEFSGLPWLDDVNHYIQFFIEEDEISETDIFTWNMKLLMVSIRPGSPHLDPRVIDDPSMVSHIKLLLDIVQKNRHPLLRGPDMNTTAYECLSRIAVYPEGRTALIKQMAVQKLSMAYLSATTYAKTALMLLKFILTKEKFYWDKENSELFYDVMDKVTIDFENSQEEDKFKISQLIRLFLSTCPKNVAQSMLRRHSWPESVRSTLMDTLSVEISDSERVEALTLASDVLTLLGIDWIFSDVDSRDFFTRLIQLALMEMREHLQDQNFEGINANIEIFTHCTSIVEAAVMGTEHRELDLLQIDGQPLIKNIDETFRLMVQLLRPVSLLKTQKLKKMLKQKHLGVVVKPLTIWLTRNMPTLRCEAVDILSILLKIGNTSFSTHQSNNSPKAGPVADDLLSLGIAVLQNILVLLRDFVHDGDIRQVLLDEKQDQVFFNYLKYHWSILQAQGSSKNRNPDDFNSTSVATQAIQDFCSIFTVVVDQDLKFVENSPTFLAISEFILDNFPKMQRFRENVKLSTNFFLLGLQLLIVTKPAIDQRVRAFVKALIFILNDDSITEMGSVLMKNLPVYLNENMDWFADFAVDSGCAAGIVGLLKKGKNNAIDLDTKSAYEKLFIRLIDVNPSVVSVLKDYRLPRVSQTYNMIKLIKYLDDKE